MLWQILTSVVAVDQEQNQDNYCCESQHNTTRIQTRKDDDILRLQSDQWIHCSDNLNKVTSDICTRNDLNFTWRKLLDQLCFTFILMLTDIPQDKNIPNLVISDVIDNINIRLRQLRQQAVSEDQFRITLQLIWINNSVINLSKTVVT